MLHVVFDFMSAGIKPSVQIAFRAPRLSNETFQPSFSIA